MHPIEPSQKTRVNHRAIFIGPMIQLTQKEQILRENCLLTLENKNTQRYQAYIGASIMAFTRNGVCIPVLSELFTINVD
jgi:hypothetical protein